MTDRELMQQALEALNHVNVQDRVQIIAALRERLAQPEQEQEPVAWIYAPTVGDGPKERRLTFVPPHEWGTQLCIDIVPLYTSPPQRKPLTEDQRKWIVATCPTPRHIIDAVEKMHGIKREE